jgi:hypothetical protein
LIPDNDCCAFNKKVRRLPSYPLVKPPQGVYGDRYLDESLKEKKANRKSDGISNDETSPLLTCYDGFGRSYTSDMRVVRCWVVLPSEQTRSSVPGKAEY